MLSLDRKSTRLNSSHLVISYAVFCLKKKKTAIYIPGFVTVIDNDRPLGKLAPILADLLTADAVVLPAPQSLDIWVFFFFNDPGTPEIPPLSLPDALPI